ncbi:hypothetical protein QK342_12540 [Myroides odoratimimus]|uniref:hypothetical protein n=1 Tax=Myroides odoratimimus TaxID=76832 RepID=UPI0024BF127E|nr:hypothetical protein [Myroides odoratimimus]WHT72532.1 hypothetical protein QK342_12540 [Myroides odoratimimus]WHU37115.1 hypothetical protein QNM93_12530 [Myroides odoratimimus]
MTSKSLYLILPFWVLVFAIYGCDNSKRNDIINHSIKEFLKNYNTDAVNDLMLKQADSIGKLVLLLPNSRGNREIIKDYINKTKAHKKYCDRLYDYAVEDRDSVYSDESAPPFRQSTPVRLPLIKNSVLH